MNKYEFRDEEHREYFRKLVTVRCREVFWSVHLDHLLQHPSFVVGVNI